MRSIEDQPYVPVDPTVMADPGFSWLGLLGMILVFLVILFVSLLIIRSLKKTTFGISDAKWVRVLDRQPLGGHQMLYLVEVAGKLQVIGGSDHGLIKVTDIEDPEVAAEILADLASRPFERDEAILPDLFNRITNFRRKKDFSMELDDLMEEANNGNFEEDR